MTDAPVLSDEERDLKVAAWMRDTCLLFGASTATAYQVAGLFIEAIHKGVTSALTGGPQDD